MTLQGKKQANYRNLIVHILCWAVVIVMPFFFHSSNDSMQEVMRRYLRSLGGPLAYMLVFYINYLWLIPRYVLNKRDIKMFVLANLLVITAGVAINQGWHDLIKFVLPSLQNHETHPDGPRPPRLPHYFYNTLVLVLFIALAVAVRMVQRWQHMEEARREAEAARAEAELSNLRNQLNPHFLLNTLNNIYALIAFDQDKAQVAVGQLSKLLRYVLYENQQNFVPLYREVAFMQNYIELMKIRVTDNVKITSHFDVADDDTTPIAPLIFISLIENAFKHGIAPNGSGEIKIEMSQHNGDITCQIHNSYYPKHANDKSGSGIGLEQVRRRLELMYPGRYSWLKGVSADAKEYYSIIEIHHEH